jgi:hypothetical protein
MIPMSAPKQNEQQQVPVVKKPDLKVLHLDQKRKDAERARLMLLGVKLQLSEQGK